MSQPIFRHRLMRGSALAAGMLAGLLLPALLRADPPPATPTYARQIAPLLAARCYKCHGPDDTNRAAELRLDRESTATGRLPSGRRAVAPGDIGRSELLARVSSADADVRMPPADAGPPLTADEIDVLRRWIAAGAPWEEHWAFRPPVRPPLPPVRQSSWPHTPVDHFVLARLEAEQLVPQPEADRETLLRRATIALTGLPPTPAEIDAFLADAADDAYERLVDRLLASPAYGERMAQVWLDAARYADTHGYHTDSHRDMWRWREWVIDAYNSGLPFDQFTRAQLAGDLLPEATLDQRIATGFLRNHMINFEDGALDEEFRTRYVVERTATVGAVWLGLTVGCAQCHDHKVDPLSQREFYQLYAFFNQVPERGIDGQAGNAAPRLRAPTRLQQQEIAGLNEQAALLRTTLDECQRLAPERVAAWRPTTTGEITSPATRLTPQLHLPLDETDGDAVLDAVAAQPRGRLVGDVFRAAGRHGGALAFTGRSYVALDDAAFGAWSAPLSVSLLVYPTTADRLLVAQGELVGEPPLRWSLHLEAGRPTISIEPLRPADDDGRLTVARTGGRYWQANDELPRSAWRRLTLVIEADRVRLYVDDQLARLAVAPEDAAGEGPDPHDSTTGWTLGGAPDRDGFRGLLDDVRYFQQALAPGEVAELAAGQPLDDWLALPAERRTPAQQRLVERYYLQTHDAAYREARRRLDLVEQRLEQLARMAPTVMVMAELAEPRPTHVLVRGEYQRPGEEVEPDTPACLPAFPADAPRDRLGLAEWLLADEHPLTARVAANRWWMIVFGRGLVDSLDDFGAAGAAPSHAELLDWLAVELREGGWREKRLVRMLVTSAAFRQAATITPATLAADPGNRLLARGPMLLLSAEEVRDGALAAAGLLVRDVGGPSVFPYQPPGLWEELSYDPREYTAQVYRQSQGGDLHRRTLYTFWKRSAPPPALEAFGAPNREVCVVERSRATSPLQALVLWNDPTYVEAARQLAARALREATGDDDARLTFVFRSTLGRRPSDDDRRDLLGLLHEERRRLAADPAAARALLAVGDSPHDERLPAIETAAWTAVAHVLLYCEERLRRP